MIISAVLWLTRIWKLWWITNSVCDAVAKKKRSNFQLHQQKHCMQTAYSKFQDKLPKYKSNRTMKKWPRKVLDSPLLELSKRRGCIGICLGWLKTVNHVFEVLFNLLILCSVSVCLGVPNSTTKATV